MDWDTKETWDWLINDLRYQWQFKQSIGNELEFCFLLYGFISRVNTKLENENKIDSSKVNGNELYISFCELNENEQEGWK